jgi:hypothetical protein
MEEKREAERARYTDEDIKFKQGQLFLGMFSRGVYFSPPPLFLPSSNARGSSPPANDSNVVRELWVKKQKK